MSDRPGKTVRMPASKLPHLRKQQAKAKTTAPRPKGRKTP